MKRNTGFDTKHNQNMQSVGFERLNTNNYPQYEIVISRYNEIRDYSIAKKMCVGESEFFRHYNLIA